MPEREERVGTVYAIATVGPRTDRGGHVTRVSSRHSVCGLHIALVGDIVTYSDGSEAATIDGAGAAGIQNGRCVALVGSRLSNGDRIVSTPCDSGKSGLVVREGEKPEGLFNPSYVPPPPKAHYRFALRGSTTAHRVSSATAARTRTPMSLLPKHQ
jgi:uncharacterized Zn-binding protein involved in type VI secretion